MSSPTFDPSFVPPESWPVLDAAAVPVSSDDELQSHWRQPRARPTQRRPEASPSSRTGMKPLPPARPSPLGEWWMNELPAQVRPSRTAQRHPHVIDQLALAWDRPAQRRLVLRDLVLADRPDRRGFSFEVLDELVRLQAYAVR